MARIGGDEFTVVQADVLDRPRPRRWPSGCCITMLRSRSSSTATTVAIGASIGIAIAPQDGIEHRAADEARRSRPLQGKSDGRNCFRFFTPADGRRQPGPPQARDGRFATPSQNDGFELNFQPLYDMPEQGAWPVSRRCCGCAYADGNALRPPSFIPVAEDMGLIGKIGTLGASQACQRGGAMAGTSHRRGQPVAGPILRRQCVRRRGRGARGERARAATARARDHRRRCCCGTPRR